MCDCPTQLHQPQTPCAMSRTLLNSLLPFSFHSNADTGLKSFVQSLHQHHPEQESGSAPDVVPHSHSPTVEISRFLNVLSFLWCLFSSNLFSRSEFLPLRGSKVCPCPAPPVPQLISHMGLGTGGLQPYLQSLDTFVCILLPLMFNEGSDIMVLEKQCFPLHKQNEVILGKRKTILIIGRKCVREILDTESGPAFSAFSNFIN